MSPFGKLRVFFWGEGQSQVHPDLESMQGPASPMRGGGGESDVGVLSPSKGGHESFSGGLESIQRL